MGYTDGPFGFIEIIIIGRSIFVSNRISEDKIGFIIIKKLKGEQRILLHFGVQFGHLDKALILEYGAGH